MSDGVTNSAQTNFDADNYIWNPDSSASASTKYRPEIEISTAKIPQPNNGRAYGNAQEEKLDSIEVEEPDATGSIPQALMQNQQPLHEAGFSKATLDRIVRLAYTIQISKRPLNPVSLNDFLTFWSSVKGQAVEPELFLAPNGNLQAEWFKNKKRRVIVEFAIPFSLCLLFDGETEWKKREAVTDLAQSLIDRTSQPLKWS